MEFVQNIKTQVKEHPRVAVGVCVLCVIIFIVIVRKSGTSTTSSNSGTVVATTAATNSYDLQEAQIGATEQANQLTAETQQQESANSLTATQAQYTAELAAQKDKDNTSVLINAQNVDLAKTQSGNALSASQAQYAAQTSQVQAQLAAQTQQAQIASNNEQAQLSAITGAMTTMYNDQLASQKISTVAGLNSGYTSAVNDEDKSGKPWQSYGSTQQAIDAITAL